MLTIIIFLLTLLILVLSHEFGHFIVAKKFNIKVLEFGFGIPPKIFGKKIGETLVSLNLLPIGGFVRLFGEDEVDKRILKNKRSFAAHAVWQRMVVVVAGVAMNLFLAALIFWTVLLNQGFKERLPLLAPHQFVGVSQNNEIMIIVGKVAPNSPASKAKIRQGDRIVKFNKTELASSDQLFLLSKSYAGEKVILTLADLEEKTREVEIVPRKEPPKDQGPLGVELGTLTVAYLSYQSFEQKLFSGITHSYNLASYSLNVLGQLIAKSIAEQNLAPVSQTISGPVGITSISNMILQTQSPFIPYLNFVGMLSLNLAIINILPFPALDGGRLFFLLIEAIFRKKVKAELERFVHTIGMAILLALIIIITFSDISKLFF